MSTPVRVVNLDEAPFEDAFDGTRYTIAPGAEAIVPDEAVALWFGDNEARNEEFNRARDAEVERLKIRYGAHFDQGITWEEAQPHVEVRTMDGTTIETVLSDPSGSTVTTANSTVSEQEELMSMIRAQSEELARLKAQFAARQREQEALESGAATQDSPKQVASKRARNRPTTDLHVELPEDAPA